ncbi:MFS transporter [Halococcus sediminicola]|uniref:MFS transporter n=1 Tax=Halococcus sediminicola TaxID=1264579 RepID=UPI0006794AE1|nr:MFS transporter [Halococcus sediminicola]
MDRQDRQFYSLYLTRFAGGFGFITLITLLPEYIDLYDPSGLVIGLFTTAFTLAQTAAVVPLAWAGDRYDKRGVLLVGCAIGLAVYVAFTFVASSMGFVLARAAQGITVTATSLMSLSLVGELAAQGTRANHIGKANAARFAAGIVGSLGAGALYSTAGFGAVFAVVAGLLALATLFVWLFVSPDGTTVGGVPFTDLALNRRLLTVSSFRAQYAVAVTLVRTWVPIYAGVAAARGGLAYGAVAVAVVITAEKFTNMVCQPYTGQLSDRFGRALFVFAGGGFYGMVALAVPFAPTIGEFLSIPSAIPFLGQLSPAFVPLVILNGLLGIADSIREPASMALFADEGTDDGGVASSFGIRELVWRPGSIAAPLLGGVLMAQVGMQWVFFVGALAAFSGVGTFLGVLSHSHGTAALTRW